MQPETKRDEQVSEVADVVAVIATYRRNDLLFRLLDSISTGNREVSMTYVVDNASDPELQEKLKHAPIPVTYIPSPGNPGCGAGLRLGEIAALESQQWQFLLILDDDAVLDEGCVRTLRQSLAISSANAAAPMILDENSGITSFPGLLGSREFQAVRQLDPEGYLKVCGPNVVRFDWCPGVCMMVKRIALETKGPHSPNFWLLGEDLEFSMRLADYNPNIFVPLARAYHLPPVGRSLPSDWIMIKEAAMLINSAYLGFHQTYCRGLLWHLPGNLFRYLKLFSFNFKAIKLAVTVIYWGAILKRTAACEDFQRLVKKVTR